MGTMQHHSIIVTSQIDLIEKAHEVATGLMPHVSPIIGGGANGQRSFAVLPDGSKEGWAESDVADDARAALIRWIDAQAYDDGSNSLSFVLVEFGELGESITPNAT